MFAQREVSIPNTTSCAVGAVWLLLINSFWCLLCQTSLFVMLEPINTENLTGVTILSLKIKEHIDTARRPCSNTFVVISPRLERKPRLPAAWTLVISQDDWKKTKRRRRRKNFKRKHAWKQRWNIVIEYLWLWFSDQRDDSRGWFGILIQWVWYSKWCNKGVCCVSHRDAYWKPEYLNVFAHSLTNHTW